MQKLTLFYSIIFLTFPSSTQAETNVGFNNTTDYAIRLSASKFSLAQGLIFLADSLIEPHTKQEKIISLNRLFGNNISGNDSITYTTEIEVIIENESYVLGEISQQVLFNPIAGSRFTYTVKLASTVKLKKEFNPLYDFSSSKTESKNNVEQATTLSLPNTARITFTLSAKRIKNAFWRNDDIQYTLKASTQKKL